MKLVNRNLGSYSELELIGEGAYGYVYKAMHHSSQRTVAIKVLKKSDKETQSMTKNVQRFLRETKLCSQLTHPHIVQLLDNGMTEDGTHYAVFEFVPGVTLESYLSEHGPLNAVDTGDLMAQVLDALCCAHKQGIIHRDLKPQNIMVSKTGSQLHAKVLDFGIGAYSPELQTSGYTNLTLTKEALGTPCYCAPEQLRGELPSTKSDLYSWGLLVLECLLGESVIQGHTTAEIYHQQLNELELPVPPAIALHPLGKLLHKVLRKRIDLRQSDSQALYQDFKHLNFASLVGDLNPITPMSRAGKSQGSSAVTELVSQTLDENIHNFYLIGERRQLTYLCCNITLEPKQDISVQLFELAETLLSDMKSRCMEIGQSFGAYHAGSLTDRVVLLFGYPFSRDDDCLRAAKSANRIRQSMRSIAKKMQQQYDFDLSVKLAIHTGQSLVKHNKVPEGMTLDHASRLTLLAKKFHIVVSAASQQLLSKHWQLAQLDPSQAIIADHKPLFYLLKERQHNGYVDIRFQQSLFVGRDQELRQLLQWLKDIQTGSGKAIYVYGEAGVGKSRLFYEFHNSLPDSQIDIYQGKCAAELRNTALHPIFNVINALITDDQESHSSDIIKNLSQRLTELGLDSSLLVPIFGRWMGLEVAPDNGFSHYSAQKQKQLLFAALKQLLYAGSRPKLIILEDLHWADPTTLEWLTSIIPELEQQQMMLLTSGREATIGQWPEQGLQKICLPKLLTSDCETLIESLAGGYPVAQPVLQLLGQRADGVPLFVEELLLFMQEKNLLQLKNQQWTLSQDIHETDIPISLKDSLNQRLQHSGLAKETAQIAAVLGREFSKTLLMQVTNQNMDKVQQHLETLIALNLIQTISSENANNAESFRFHHALIRDSAYESLLLSHRKNLHQQAALALEAQLHASNKGNNTFLIGQIAHHFTGAQWHDKAIHYGTIASQNALERFQLEEAIEYAEKARQLILNRSIANQSKQEISINSVLLQAMMSRHGWASQQAKYYVQRARDLTENIPITEFDDSAVWALATNYFYYFVGNQRQSLLEVCHRVQALSTQRPEFNLHSVSALMFAFDHYNRAEFKLASAAFETTTKHYDATHHTKHMHYFGLDIWVWATACKGVIHWRMGQIDLAHSYGDEAINKARSLNHMPSLCIAMLYRSIVYQYAGDKENVQKLTQDILDIAQEYGLPAYQGYASLVHLWAMGQSDLAECDQIIDLLKAMGCVSSLTYYASLPAQLAAENGDLEGAKQRITQCLALSEEYGELSYLAELYRFRAELESQEAEPDYSQIQQDWALCHEEAKRSSLQPLLEYAQIHLNSTSSHNKQTISEA